MSDILNRLIEKVENNLFKKISNLKLTSIHLSLTAVSQEFIQECHDRGLKVYVFTVNEKEDYDRIQNMQADGIFTDYPDKFMWRVKSEKCKIKN